MSLSRALWLALWLAGSTRVHAQPSQHVQGRSPLASLVPSDQERLHDRERELSLRLERLLRGLASVRDARVDVTLPDLARAPLDQPVPRAKVSLVLSLAGAAPPAEQVHALVRGRAAELEHADVTFTHTRVPQPVAAREPLVSVGPFRVSPASALGLRVMLAVSLLANVTLATFLIVRMRRRSRARGAY